MTNEHKESLNTLYQSWKAAKESGALQAMCDENNYRTASAVNELDCVLEDMFNPLEPGDALRELLRSVGGDEMVEIFEPLLKDEPVTEETG